MIGLYFLKASFLQRFHEVVANGSKEVIHMVSSFHLVSDRRLRAGPQILINFSFV